MSPRRFCFVTTFYPPESFGGDAIAVERMARALARRGHDVTVVHDADAFAVLDRYRGRHEDTAAEPGGVRVVTLRSRHPALSILLTQQTGHPVVNGRRLRALLDAGAFDVIVFNNVSLIGGPGCFTLGRGALKVYVAHEHWLVCPTHVLWRYQREPCDQRQCLRCQLQHWRPPQLWRYTSRFDRQLQEIDLFIALSEFSRSKHREFGFTREMSVLPPFVPDPDEPATAVDGPRPHAGPYFLCAGRLEPIKGVGDVIDAFAGVTGADLVVVGDGTERDALVRRAAGNPRIHFTGQLPSDRLGTYYRHAIAAIAPSRGFETFGFTPVEAFRHRTPAIARRIGSLAEIIGRSGGGLLFDETAELTSAAHLLIRDPNHRAALGSAGYEAYRRYWSESAVVPRFLDMIEAADRRRTATPSCAQS